MKKHDKEGAQAQLNAEKAVIKEIEKQYKQAVDEIDDKIASLLGRSDADMQNVIYQVQYQRQLKTQVQSILEQLQANEFETISEFLAQSYQDGFVGAMYSLHSQGVPLIIPIDQKAVVKAVQTDSKLSHNLYTELGIDMTKLKKSVTSEITRGIASNMSYDEIARGISLTTKAPLSRTKTIVRTEAHRIQQAAAHDACVLAKSKGADVVKQWDSTLDGDTRPTHRELDGQIVELEEPFKAGGKSAKYPGDFGDPAEDCNCRCRVNQRAKWALGKEELQTLKERAAYFGLDKSDSLKDFEKKYMKAAEAVVEDNQKSSAKTVKTTATKTTETVENTGENAIIAVSEASTNTDKSDSTGTATGQAVNTVNIGKKVTQEQLTDIENRVVNASENVRTAWNACADQYELLDTNYTGTPHYDPAKGGVFLDMATTTKGDTYKTPYQTFFHEFGHNTDYILNQEFGTGDSRKAFSETYKNGIFGKTIKEEANSAIEQYARDHNMYKVKNIDFNALQAEADKLVAAGTIGQHDVGTWMSKKLDEAVKNARSIDRSSAESAFCKQMKDTLTPRQRGMISDMFEPVMLAANERPFGSGHGSTYWWHRDNGKEAFAHMFSAEMTNPESLEQIKKYFPKSYAIFEEMLRVIQ